MNDPNIVYYGSVPKVGDLLMLSMRIVAIDGNKFTLEVVGFGTQIVIDMSKTDRPPAEAEK
jgi:hypothetical protein